MSNRKYWWTDEQLAEIRRLAPTHSGTQVARTLGLTLKAIKAACTGYQISFDKSHLKVVPEGDYFDWACYPGKRIII
jgi:hypothetical protein